MRMLLVVLLLIGCESESRREEAEYEAEYELEYALEDALQAGRCSDAREAWDILVAEGLRVEATQAISARRLEESAIGCGIPLNR